MKQLSIALLFTVILVSCNKKTVLLPETVNKDITQVLDVSPIYMLYDETKPDSTDFNRKNMISTTNWLVNIDKRLTLKQILPHLQYLQEKRKKDGMHKNENAKNYFTCSNPKIQNLAFIEFTDLAFHMIKNVEIPKKSNNINSEVQNNLIADKLKNRAKSLDISMELPIYILSNDSVNILGIETPFSEIVNKLKNTNKNSANEILHIKLYFNKNLSFQDYITYKSLLLDLNLDYVTVSNNEFIYN